MDDLPVAMVDYSNGSPVVYDIHADHLGRPQKMTDQTGVVVWDANYDLFGIPRGHHRLGDDSALPEECGGEPKWKGSRK